MRAPAWRCAIDTAAGQRPDAGMAGHCVAPAGPLRVVHLVDAAGPGGVDTVLGALQQLRLATACRQEVVWLQPGRCRLPQARADVIVLHRASNWRCLPGLLHLRLRQPRARLLLLEHHYTGAVEQHVPSRRRFHCMLRQSYRLVDAVIAVSRAQGQWLLERDLLPRHKLRVISPCPDLGRFWQVAPPQLARPLVLGAYGRLHRQKGFDLLIEAVRRLAPGGLRLLIGGSGPEADALRQQAADLPQVEFTGAVSDVPAFLGRCDVVVVPSRHEPYGLVCLEARAAGRPVVVSDVDGLPDQVDDCGLVVPPGDVEALANALGSLAEQPLTVWGRTARASTRDARERCQSAWEDLLQPVTGRGPSDRGAPVPY